MMQKIQQRMVAHFDVVTADIRRYSLNTKPHFTLWLSARTLQRLFEGV